MNSAYDVVICGAGSAGVAAAYYLAINHQITNVLIVDKHAPLSQTSAKSGENIRNWWPTQPMIDLANRSFELMEELMLASKNVFNLERQGYAYVTEDPSILSGYLAHYRSLDVGDLRIHEPDQFDLQYEPPAATYADNRIAGADILLDPWVIRQTFPHFSQNVEAVIHARRAGSISAQQLGQYLLQEAKIWGAHFERATVVDVEVVDVKVVDVETTDGADTADKATVKQVSAVIIQNTQGIHRIETRRFVNAAGPFANHIAQMLGQALPITNIFQQKIAFQDPLRVIPRNAPFTIFMDKQQVNWSPEERRFLADDPTLAWMVGELPGGVHIKPEGGNDSTWLKLGWAYNQLGEEPLWEPNVNELFPELLMRAASRLVPQFKHYFNNIQQPLVHYGGYYTKTEENLPLIGPMGVDENFVSGAYMVGALSGFGTMMSCAAGELLAKWVAHSALPAYANIFSLERYADPELIDVLKAQAKVGEL